MGHPARPGMPATVPTARVRCSSIAVSQMVVGSGRARVWAVTSRTRRWSWSCPTAGERGVHRGRGRGQPGGAGDELRGDQCAGDRYGFEEGQELENGAGEGVAVPVELVQVPGVPDDTAGGLRVRRPRRDARRPADRRTRSPGRAGRRRRSGAGSWAPTDKCPPRSARGGARRAGRPGPGPRSRCRRAARHPEEQLLPSRRPGAEDAADRRPAPRSAGSCPGLSPAEPRPRADAATPGRRPAAPAPAPGRHGTGCPRCRPRRSATPAPRHPLVPARLPATGGMPRGRALGEPGLSGGDVAPTSRCA